MTVAFLEQRPPHPARLASIRSIRAIESRDRAGWLGLWREDGVVEDPVGVSPLDPAGEGHRGRDAIAAFYDNVISQGDVRFHIRESFACGSECANVGTITTRSGAGAISRCELVMVYRVDGEGRLASLRAFWEFEALVAGMF